MKLGIFGDSYADTNGDDDHYSWPNLLAKQYNTEIFGLCGTSTWWSYQNFLKNYTKYDSIIFCHSSANRWPILPDDLIGGNWDISNARGPKTPEKLRKMNEFYFDIFDENILKFLNYNIFQSVNDICKKNNIYLINLICFTKEFEVTTDYPVFYDLHQVSLQETVSYNNKKIPLQKYLPIAGVIDLRICHMGHKNNKILADIFSSLLDNKIMNVHSELIKDYNWTSEDESLQKIFSIP